MRKTNFGNFEWIPGHLYGQNVFCIASGPSLKKYQPPATPGAEEAEIWKRFKKRLYGTGFKRIIISHVSQFLEPDFVVFLDAPVMQKLKYDYYGAPWKTVVGRNIILEPKGQVAKVNYANTPQLKPQHGFYGSFSTGYFALNLAISMGAEKIYLVGYDCGGGGETGNAPNFYNTNAIKGYRRGDAERYERMAQGFDEFKHFKNIYNTSPNSAIKTFKKVDIEEVIGKI